MKGVVRGRLCGMVGVVVRANQAIWELGKAGAAVVNGLVQRFVEGEGRSLSFSSWSLAKLMAWDREIGWNAWTSR